MENPAPIKTGIHGNIPQAQVFKHEAECFKILQQTVPVDAKSRDSERRVRENPFRRLPHDCF
jgi:hypothetical protein